MTVTREKQCTQCNETKPSKQFKRRLTIAQSRSMLRNPKINTPYITTSKLCKDCQPKPKPPRLLSSKEIRTKITTGDINKSIGEAMLEERRRVLPKKRARVMKEYWQAKKAKPLKELRRALSQQVSKYANRYNAYKGTKTPQHAMLSQHRWNYAEAKRVRQDLMTRAQAGEKIDPSVNIASLIKPMKYNQGEQA